MGEVKYGWTNCDATNAHAYILKPIQDFLPLKSPLKIADLGCGNGLIAGFVSNLGHEVTAVDSSDDGIALAKEKYSSVNFFTCSVYDDLVSKIGDAYDVVISSEVIEHLYNPKSFLKNTHKILKPGGTLILTTPYNGYLKNLALAITGKWDNHFTADWDGGHIKFFSTKTLKKMLKDQGFQDIDFRFAGRMPFLWKSMVFCAKK